MVSGYSYAAGLSAIAAGLIVLLTTQGCMVTRIDKLPKGTPRGYVMFYAPDRGMGREGLGGHPVNGVEIFETTGRKNNKLTEVAVSGCLIAARPGRHDYRLRLGDASRNVHVDIEEDRVTYVEIIAQVIDVDRGPFSTTTRFFMKPVVHDTVSLGKHAALEIGQVWPMTSDDDIREMMSNPQVDTELRQRLLKAMESLNDSGMTVVTNQNGDIQFRFTQ